MPKNVPEQFRSFAIKHNFISSIQGAEIHWYFIEGAEAFHQGLYLASLLSLVNGIESSLRALLMYKSDGVEQDDLIGKNLCNGLIRDAQQAGMKVEILALSTETHFSEKLKNRKTPVEIVRLRNNLCHGNVFEFFQSPPDAPYKVFTPESVKPLAEEILKVSENWAGEIGRFKEQVIQA